MKQHKRGEGALRNGSQVEVGDGALQLSLQNKQLSRRADMCSGFKRNCKTHRKQQGHKMTYHHISQDGLIKVCLRCFYIFLSTHHNEIIEEEDFSLVCCLFLGLVDVCHLKKSTTANQSSVRDRQHLQRHKHAYIQLRGDFKSVRLNESEA